MTKTNKIIEKHYSQYNIFKSTGFIVPTLFAFLITEVGVSATQILQVTAFYMLLPFLLEIPLGLFADKLGHKLTVMIGVCFQIGSCLSLLFIRGVASYHVYLIAIYTAGACLSGAETALIYTKNRLSNTQYLKNYTYKLNSDFYKYTIFFLIAGGLSYSVHPKIPIVLQIISFSIALYHLSRIDKKQGQFKNTQLTKNSIADLYISLQFVVKDKPFLATCIISAVFTAAIRINDKTIQPQMLTYIDQSSYFLIGLIYAIGNAVSSKSSMIFKRFADRFTDNAIQYIILIVIMGSSFFVMSLNSVYCVIPGFLLLCFFKAAHRPLITHNLNSNIPFKKLHATIISCSALFGAIFGAAIHWISSLFFRDFSK